ncbi:MAG: NAD-dependent epimerase/dehydratase family protein [Planctomycetota bacterium]|nr:NAD-dependent epimerase/dehydratase family protein [Planctomycetota bacterium]
MKLSAEKRTGLPATDVYRFGRVDKLMDALERHYKKKRRAK